jgi:hypothetical protein
MRPCDRAALNHVYLVATADDRSRQRLLLRAPALTVPDRLVHLAEVRHRGGLAAPVARLGDPEAARRQRRHDASVAAEREHMAKVIDDMVAADDSEMLVMSMLRGRDLQDALVDESVLPGKDPDLLAGPFAHVVVDEAQELTDAEWQMLLPRCPSRSFTIVGDRAQARHGFTESWQERLERIGLDQINLASLSINYRTPQEIGKGIEGAVDRYVVMTRATQQLVLLTNSD